MRHQTNFVEFPPVRCNNLIAGLTAVIGIIGGIFLITKTTKDFYSKISDRKKKELSENEYFCNVCCAEIDPEDNKTFVQCYQCQKHICRSVKCADWLPKTAQWECELCQTSKESLAQTSSWVADQISFHKEKLIYPARARSEIFIPISECNDSSIMHFESVSQIGANLTMITAEQKFKIREYVEEVVANLLGGNLDNIAVNQLSQSENYLSAPKESNFHQQENGGSTNKKSRRTSEGPNVPDFTDISETRLRQMIQSIIAETINMPPLSNTRAVSEIALDRRTKPSDTITLTNGFHQKHRTECYFEPTIYQDLLATAVLNKIVDIRSNNNQIQQSGRTFDQTNIGDDTVARSDGIRLVNMDQNFNIETLSTTSGSSVEPRSDCSCSEMDPSINTNNEKTSELLRNADRDLRMSDYLASHMVPLPSLSAVATESDEDEYMSVTSSAVEDGNWEDNWLFKKKKPTLGESVAASSVAMLVPDPRENVRAQIGDKTTDEISDLSELGSDTDDSLDSLRSKLDPINVRLINKHLIGGQNNKLVLDELIESSSIMLNTLEPKPQQAYTDTCNKHVIDVLTRNEAINNNINQQASAVEQEVKTVDVISPPVESEDLNSNPSTDQLSYDFNPCDDSRTSTVEEYIEYNNDDNDEKDNLVTKFNSTTTTTFSTNPIICANPNITSNTTTNSITNKSNNKSLRNNTTINTLNRKGSNGVLTSAVQNNESFSYSQIGQSLCTRMSNNLKQHFSNDKSEVEIQYDKEIIENTNHNGDGDRDRDRDSNGDDNYVDDEEDKVAILRHFLPGSIAEREYKKWYNAVEMPNNPYAPEALRRRISGSQERIIDIPNISPTKELNTLEILNKETLDVDQTEKRESDCQRYSRDYYINSNSASSQTSPARKVSISESKDMREPSPLKSFDVYKAIPAQVVENINSSGLDLEENTITSDDSDTIKLKTANRKGTNEPKSRERDNNLAPSTSENNENFITPIRGSTPSAFKFLQPKRKLLDPSQVLSVDEAESPIATSPVEKTVIEADIAQALPSVKALARAFLLTTNTTQPEKLWLRKARTLSLSGKKHTKLPGRSLDPATFSEQPKTEEDITISSDLSSLETDSSSAWKVLEQGKDLTSPNESTTNNSTIPIATGTSSPVPVRQGVLKSNIAFFENLKHK